jgi:hypothetical protein
VTQENNTMRHSPGKLSCAVVLALWGLSGPIANAGIPPDSGSEQGQLEMPSDFWLATSLAPLQATTWDALVSKTLCRGCGFQAEAVSAPVFHTKDDPGACCECNPPVGVSKGSLTDCMWLQLTAGALFSPTHGIGPHDEPTLDLAPFDVRLGLMLNEPDPERQWIPGVWSIILDIATEPVINGYGNIVVGPVAMVRYDFVRQGWGLIPYLQGGAGLVYNDCYEDQHQDTIGQSVEFLLRVDLGVHCPISPQWSIDAEFNFQHISNADLANRNAGFNGLGATIGLTYFFRR